MGDQSAKSGSKINNSLFAEYEPRPPIKTGQSKVNYEIRPTTVADLQCITNLIHAREGGTPSKILDKLTQQLRDGHDRYCIIVAVSSNQVIGWARSAYFTPQPNSPSNIAPEGWYLAGLIVSPKYRRHSIGIALTRYRLEWLSQRASSIYYFANALNSVTIELHDKIGFKEVTRDFTFPGVTFSGEGIGILFSINLKARQ